MVTPSQRRASEGYRSNLAARGMARYEVVGLRLDKILIRDLARRLSRADEDAARLRAEIGSIVKGLTAQKGGVLAALRRSPLVGLDLAPDRADADARRVEL